jgi:5'-3' exonuclease
MNILKKFKVDKTQDNGPYIKEMCMEYFKGMQWIMRYYMAGHNAISSQYIYVYHYAPLIQDMFRVLNEAIIENGITSLPTIDSISSSLKDPVITPIHQLLMVQPKKSWDLIPGKYRYLLDDPLRDISPIQFEVDAEGQQAPPGKTGSYYTDIAILSIVDPKRVIDITEQFPIPSKYLAVKTKFILKRVGH